MGGAKHSRKAWVLGAELSRVGDSKSPPSSSLFLPLLFLPPQPLGKSFPPHCARAPPPPLSPATSPAPVPCWSPTPSRPLLTPSQPCSWVLGLGPSPVPGSAPTLALAPTPPLFPAPPRRESGTPDPVTVPPTSVLAPPFWPRPYPWLCWEPGPGPGPGSAPTPTHVRPQRLDSAKPHPPRKSAPCLAPAGLSMRVGCRGSEVVKVTVATHLKFSYLL